MVFSSELIAGICCGTIQNLIGHPLDSLKVLSQTKENLKYIKVRQLYNGFTFPLYKLVLTGSLSFDFNERMTANNFKNNYLNGAIIGVSLSPIVHICDIFKIKQQTNLKYNISDFIKPQNIYLTLLRETLANSVYFGSYFSLKEYGVNPFIAGGIAGSLNWTTTYPIDTIKTRSITYNFNLKQCINMGSYWRGYGICLIRAFLVNSAGFGTYEISLQFLKKNLK